MQYLNQKLAVINDFAYIRDLSPLGSLHSLEPGDEVPLKSWTTAPPESQLEEKRTEPWDILLTTPHHGEVGRDKKPWILHTRVRKSPEAQWTTEPQKALKAIFWKQ